MNEIKHYNSLEFEIAENIWCSATDRETQIRALDIYKLAIKKNDARAFLAFHKINEEWATSYLLTGKQHSGSEYLAKAIKLCYLPAFLYGGCVENFRTYDRLVYLSTGMHFAHQAKDPILKDLQEKFIFLSKDLPKEFILEILKRGENWNPGEPVDLSKSKLEWTLIRHPTNYKSDSDHRNSTWFIFPESEKLEQYLQKLPGYQDYVLASEAEDKGDLDLWRFHLKNAAKRGNGQASYALNNYLTIQELINCAENGSPDAFDDLFEKLYLVNNIRDFTNTADLSRSSDSALMTRIDCLLYIFTIMERLGIAKYAEYGLEVDCLSLETDSGYSSQRANLSELKYLLTDHHHVCSINHRASGWYLGKKFDSKFLADFLSIDLN